MVFHVPSSYGVISDYRSELESNSVLISYFEYFAMMLIAAVISCELVRMRTIACDPLTTLSLVAL